MAVADRNTVMILDAEATDMKVGVLLQLAYQIVDVTTRGVVKKFSSYVSDLPRDAVVSSRATKTHGITLARASAEGRPLAAVLREAITDAQHCSFVVAHNALADLALLVRECTRVGLRWPFVPMQCTQLLSTPLCQLPHKPGTAKLGYKFPKLGEAHALLVGRGEPPNLHDAAGDVAACRDVWFAILDKDSCQTHSPSPTRFTPAQPQPC